MNSSFPRQIIRNFQPDANLAKALPGYVYREEQVKLAGEIAECMEAGGRLPAEAETGTGKTLAYLVPALRSDLKVLISTHTRALAAWSRLQRSNARAVNVPLSHNARCSRQGRLLRMQRS